MQSRSCYIIIGCVKNRSTRGGESHSCGGGSSQVKGSRGLPWHFRSGASSYYCREKLAHTLCCVPHESHRHLTLITTSGDDLTQTRHEAPISLPVTCFFKDKSGKGWAHMLPSVFRCVCMWVLFVFLWSTVIGPDRLRQTCLNKM